MVSTLHRSAKRPAASSWPDRHDGVCVGMASVNVPGVGARALPDQWSRPSGDKDVICELVTLLLRTVLSEVYPFIVM